MGWWWAVESVGLFYNSLGKIIFNWNTFAVRCFQYQAPIARLCYRASFCPEVPFNQRTVTSQLARCVAGCSLPRIVWHDCPWLLQECSEWYSSTYWRWSPMFIVHQLLQLRSSLESKFLLSTVHIGRINPKHPSSTRNGRKKATKLLNAPEETGPSEQLASSCHASG